MHFCLTTYTQWNKKMEKLHFGYKCHTVTEENGLVLAEETMATNESDINHLETPLKKAGLPSMPIKARIWLRTGRRSER